MRTALALIVTIIACIIVVQMCTKAKIEVLLSSQSSHIEADQYDLSGCDFQNISDGSKFLFCKSEIKKMFVKGFTGEYTPDSYIVVVENGTKEEISHELFHLVVSKANKDCDLKVKACQEKYAKMYGEIAGQLLK